MFHESRGCLYQPGSSLTLMLPASGLGTHLLWWPWVQQRGSKHRLIAHTVPAVLVMQWLTSMACFLSSLKQMLLLWQNKNMLPLCLNVFQQSLGRCLGTLSSKLHTHLLFLRKHTYRKCVWNRSYFPTSTPLNSPPTLALHLSFDLSAWYRLAMPFSCIEKALLCCPTLHLTSSGLP